MKSETNTINTPLHLNAVSEELRAVQPDSLPKDELLKQIASWERLLRDGANGSWKTESQNDLEVIRAYRLIICHD